MPHLKDPSPRLGVLIRGFPLRDVLGIGHHLEDVLSSLSLWLDRRLSLALGLDLDQVSITVGHFELEVDEVSMCLSIRLADVWNNYFLRHPL